MNTTNMIAAVRDHLQEPTGGTGIYSDAQITTALRDAYHMVVSAHPTITTYSYPVSAGSTVLTLNAPALSIVSVTTTYAEISVGTPAEMATPPSPARDRSILLYRHEYGTSVQLSRPVQPAEAGTWKIMYRHIPAFPPVAGTDWLIPDALEAPIRLYAVASLLRSRLMTMNRRGSQTDYAAVAIIADAEANAALALKRYGRRSRMT